jgi:DNA-binding GntR family transcriptional regulator
MFKNDDNNGLLAAPSQRTLSDYVADQLRQAILVGQLKPNQRLVEEELAASMQTSRGPVRDALRMLETEGLVVRQSHRGAFVAELRDEDVLEIYSLREALESLALENIIRKATNEQIEELEKLVRSMEQMAQHDYNQIEATDIDMAFHHTLCKISGHKRLLITWEALSAQIRLVLLKHRLRNPTDLKERSVVWHQAIIEAIRKRDIDKALGELHKHMDASTEWIIKSIEADRQRNSAS